MSQRLDEFTATAAAYEITVDVEAKVLVLAERPDGDGRTLEVQRALDPSDDEERLPCLVLDAGPTCFGAVDSWSLDDGVVELTLTSDAATTFSTDRFRVHLAAMVPTEAVGAALDHLLDDGPDASEFNSTG